MNSLNWIDQNENLNLDLVELDLRGFDSGENNIENWWEFENDIKNSVDLLNTIFYRKDWTIVSFTSRVDNSLDNVGRETRLKTYGAYKNAKDRSWILFEEVNTNEFDIKSYWKNTRLSVWYDKKNVVELSKKVIIGSPSNYSFDLSYLDFKSNKNWSKKNFVDKVYDKWEDVRWIEKNKKDGIDPIIYASVSIANFCNKLLFSVDKNKWWKFVNKNNKISFVFDNDRWKKKKIMFWKIKDLFGCSHIKDAREELITKNLVDYLNNEIFFVGWN